jgi:hypothetical protein
MRKKWKKKKKRDLSFAGLGEGFLAHPGRERAYGPAAAHERRRRRGCARVTASLRAHSLARAEGGGGETALRPDGVGEPAERGRRAGRRWARRRFAAGGLWVRDWGWEVVLRVHGLVRELPSSLNFSLDQRRGRGRRGEDSPERGKTTALRELRSGEGRRRVVESGVGKEVSGAAFL